MRHTGTVLLLKPCPCVSPDDAATDQASFLGLSESQEDKFAFCAIAWLIP